MPYKKLLIAGTLSTLVLGTTLFAQGSNCVGGVCFVKFDKIKPTKGFKKEKKSLVVLEQPRYIEIKSEPVVHNVVVQDRIDKTIEVIIDNQDVFVFPSYVMTDAEKVVYYSEQQAIALNKKENMEANIDLQIVSKSVEKVEEKILEKTVLPTSEYYCEKDQHPVYDKFSDSFECVT